MSSIASIVVPTLLSAASMVADRATSPAEAVLRWSRLATDATASVNADPLTESRTFAIVHAAMHDALNAIDSRYEPYSSSIARAPGASTTAAVAAAAHDAMVELMPSSKSAMDAALDADLRSIATGDAQTRGVEVGRRAAANVLAQRKDDGSARKIDLAPGTHAGEYRPTPPDFTPAWAAHWGDVTPFVLRSGAQFRPEAPPAPDSARARAEVEELRSIGVKEASTRTPEQSEIARHWYENSTQGWNRIARDVAEQRGLDAWDSARMLALLNLAMADGYVASFEAKYHYNYWRPATAIRESGDPQWLSYLVTPPIPDHPSGHTVLGAVAATVMERCFGTDFVAFTTKSGAPYPGIVRSYWSFSEAARENGASRVFAGIHFPTAVRAGYRQGEEIGAWVCDNALRRVDARAADVASHRR